MGRSLLVSLQLAETGKPFIFSHNMVDEAKSRGISIDSKKLSEILGVDVVPTIATQRQGLHHLIQGISRAKQSHYSFRYDQNIEEALEKITLLLPKANISKRSIALMLLAGDESLGEWTNKNLSDEAIRKIEKLAHRVQLHYGQPLSYVINQQRLEKVDQILGETLTVREAKKTSVTMALGELSMHPRWGVPIFLLVLYVTYKFVGQFGGGDSG